MEESREGVRTREGIDKEQEGRKFEESQIVKSYRVVEERPIAFKKGKKRQRMQGGGQSALVLHEEIESEGHNKITTAVGRYNASRDLLERRNGCCLESTLQCVENVFHLTGALISDWSLLFHLVKDLFRFLLHPAINKEARNLPNLSTKTKSDSPKETMAEPYVEQVEYLDVLTKIGKKIGKKIGGSKPRHVPSFLSISGLSVFDLST
ncbi:uncharacterized protein [Gossypium hirsutum]|uniref:Uncharacterized protein n=1 Tax=Gossypium hirsutum TaxID=3635 RepID=A0ABM2ZNJ7_GOSHI|nr:uncharacterized protein LOC107951291 [Gossypium hirsutum]